MMGRPCACEEAGNDAGSAVCSAVHLCVQFSHLLGWFLAYARQRLQPVLTKRTFAASPRSRTHTRNTHTPGMPTHAQGSGGEVAAAVG